MNQIHLVRHHQRHLIHLIQIVRDRNVPHLEHRADRSAGHIDLLRPDEVVVHILGTRTNHRFDRGPDVTVENRLVTDEDLQMAIHTGFVGHAGQRAKFVEDHVSFIQEVVRFGFQDIGGPDGTVQIGDLLQFEIDIVRRVLDILVEVRPQILVLGIQVLRRRDETVG